MLEIPIRDMSVYTCRMQKSILDKMFFMDKVFEPFSTIVDFGCANGELIKAFQMLFGQHQYVGYDISDEMLSAARRNVPAGAFYSKWNDIDVDFSQSLLNISSTLHEVYSYGSESDVDEFWQRVFSGGFKYIALRDMMLSTDLRRGLNVAWYEQVLNNGQYAEKLRSFEAVWGKISNQYDLIHYLLKYKYTENWEREVRENYVPVTVEEFMAKIPEEYEITYLDHFVLPYTVWQIQKDYGFTLNTPTHVKIVLRKK